MLREKLGNLNSLSLWSAPTPIQPSIAKPSPCILTLRSSVGYWPVPLATSNSKIANRPLGLRQAMLSSVTSALVRSARTWTLRSPWASRSHETLTATSPCTKSLMSRPSCVRSLSSSRMVRFMGGCLSAEAPNTCCQLALASTPLISISPVTSTAASVISTLILAPVTS